MIPRQVGAERQAPLDPGDRSHRLALLGGVMGMKQTLHWHYWVLEPPHQPESLLIHTQTLQYHMSLGVGRGKEQQPPCCPSCTSGPCPEPCRLFHPRAQHSQQGKALPQPQGLNGSSNLQGGHGRALLMVIAKSKGSSPGYQAQTTSTQHAFAGQCDQSQQQWPCHMPSCMQVPAPLNPCSL